LLEDTVVPLRTACLLLAITNMTSLQYSCIGHIQFSTGNLNQWISYTAESLNFRCS